MLAGDIAGAFDKVSHVGVLHKLPAYGIDGTLHRWLTSYLSNRNLQAVVGSVNSQAFPVTAGVPQGSILGPTLFIVYVNDVPDVLPLTQSQPHMQTTPRCSLLYHPLMMFQPGVQSFSEQ